MEIKITLQPKQRLAIKTSETHPVTFFGGAKGGGKSYCIRAREIKRRLQYPGTKGLIVRKTYPELLDNHIRPMIKEYPMLKEWYTAGIKAIKYPNGSLTEFSYLQHTNDVYNYQGREYEDISIDEITQHEQEVFTIIRSSNRTTNPNIKPSMFLTGNPGGIGHGWVKRLFIDRKFTSEEEPEDYAFVPAKVFDNKALVDADPNYIKRLKALPPYLVKAYLEGEWNIFAGQAFPELSESVHVIDPIKLPEPVRWFGGYDWGHEHPFAFVLCAMTTDRKIYVTNYAHSHHKNVQQQAELIKNVVGDKRAIVYLGHDAFADRGFPTIARQLIDAMPNITFTRATVKRVHGVSVLREQISYKQKKEKKPNLVFFRNAEKVYNTLATMQYDEKFPEDVMKIDAVDGEGGDDLYDALRYAVTSYLAPLSKKAEKIDVHSGEYLMEKIKEETRRRRASVALL